MVIALSVSPLVIKGFRVVHVRVPLVLEGEMPAVKKVVKFLRKNA